MRKRIAILAALASLAATVTFLVHSNRPQELMYQGKSVSAWAFQLYGPVGREEATRAFGELREQAVPDLIRMLSSKDPLLSKVLYPIPDWLPRPLEVLIRRAVRPADASSRRIVAANAAASLGSNAAPAVAALAPMFAGKSQNERWAAATALGRVATPEAVQVCIEALQGTNQDLHHAAVYALGEMGATAEPALPTVLSCLTHPREVVRVSAIHALTRIGRHALPVLVRIVRQERGVGRRAAAEALVKLWAPPRVAVPPLVEMLEDPDPRSRLQALDCLVTLAPWHKDVSPALTNLLDDVDANVRTAAAQALAKASRQPK